MSAVSFDAFVVYLNDHLSDNGQPGSVYFQPLPRAESVLSPERALGFRQALEIAVGAPGWRRLWVAFTVDRKLVGHIDLRAYPDKLAAHRCLLGMGVHRHVRQVGLGRRLIEHAEQWARDEDVAQWIDLQVLSVNEPAIRLYLRAGFVKTGEVPDMFRIDGQSLAFTGMSKQLSKQLADRGA